MIDISEIVRTWPTVDGWSISPGVPWCAAGNRVRVGANASIGGYVSLGDRCSLGDGVSIGDWCSLSADTRLSDNVRIGDNVSIGGNVTFARDLGVQSRYRHALVVQDGEVKFVGGCHSFTFAEAREYWSGKPNRVETLAAVDFAETLAHLIPETKAILERSKHERHQ